MLALVPESMASIRWLIGWPSSILAPESVLSLSRTSCIISSFERSFNSYGASISLPFTPRECSSNSARPVLRATVWISGMESKSSSARRPSLSDSSSDTPGMEVMLIVKEPSLNEGRNERPNVKKPTNAPTKSTPVLPNTIALWFNAHNKAFW